MKYVIFLFALISVGAVAQQPCNCLCAANETNVYSFQTASKKTVSLCKERSEKYMVYRFGTQAKTELQFPEQLDEASWKKFTYRFYLRGGGKENDAKDLNWVSFTNKGVEYTVYSEYYSENNAIKVGITVTTPEGKDIDIKGVTKSQTGTLTDFRDNTKIVKEDY
jgi:hypothetical protein